MKIEIHIPDLEKIKKVIINKFKELVLKDDEFIRFIKKYPSRAVICRNFKFFHSEVEHLFDNVYFSTQYSLMYGKLDIEIALKDKKWEGMYIPHIGVGNTIDFIEYDAIWKEIEKVVGMHIPKYYSHRVAKKLAIQEALEYLKGHPVEHFYSKDIGCGYMLDKTGFMLAYGQKEKSDPEFVAIYSGNEVIHSWSYEKLDRMLKKLKSASKELQKKYEEELKEIKKQKTLLDFAA